jgi:hypothetical protein
MKDEALKLALEALELLTDTEQTFGALDYGDNAITAIKEALAQPEQQPVIESWREFASDYERGFIDGMQKQAQSSVDKAVNRMAQRPWVGLTKDDTLEIAEKLGLADVAWLDLMVAIEAKLKERNA